MDISGKIVGIKYKVLFANKLKEINIKGFDINEMPSVCLLNNNKNTIAISKWVSPKRTRSYPYERIYNTLNISKKITVIPIVKDEGQEGDRDFLQWDTVSLMSLLDVFVIFAYYSNAEKAKNKITNQQFDNKYILSKIKEIEQYHSSALHWNLNELKNNLHKIIDKAKVSYISIEQATKVKLHSISGLDNFKEKIGKDVSHFLSYSRDKAQKAQLREFTTIQPKESLSTISKAKITITNYLGGQYFFTVDEISFSQSKLNLIECKHSKSSLLPSKGDIKDGLLKLILYSNLTEVKANKKKVKYQVTLKLTSSKLKGSINSQNSKEEINSFAINNSFSTQHLNIVETIFKEARQNNFIIQIQNSK